MGIFLTDNFTDSNGVALSAHTSDSGATWTAHGSFGGGLAKIQSNRLYGDSSGGGYYASAVPSGNEYAVNASVFVASIIGAAGQIDIAGRYSPSAFTGYRCHIEIFNNTTIRFTLFLDTGGGSSSLGTYDLTGVLANDVISVKLDIKNAAKNVFINGVARITSTDNANTDVGRVLVFGKYATTTTSLHLDSLTADQASNDLIATLPMFTLAITAQGPSALVATLPPLSVAFAISTGGVGNVAATLPMLTIAAHGGPSLGITATFPLLEAALDGYSYQFDAQFPLLEADLTGLMGIVGAIEASFSLFESVIVGGMDGINAAFPGLQSAFAGSAGVTGRIDGEWPRLTAALDGVAIIDGVMAAKFPLLDASISAEQGILATLDALFPALKSSFNGATGSAGVMAGKWPLLHSEFVAFQPYTATLTATFPLLAGQLSAALAIDESILGPMVKALAINLKHGALTEYDAAFDFNSFALFNGQALAANSDGIHQLGGAFDEDVPITMRVSSGKSDLGRDAAARLKRATDAYISYQSGGAIRFSLVVDDVAYDYLLSDPAPVIKTHQLDLGRGLKTRYLQWQIENCEGQTLDVDDVMLLVEVLQRRI